MTTLPMVQPHKIPRRCANCAHWGKPVRAAYAQCSIVTDDWVDGQQAGTPYILPPAGDGLWTHEDWSCPGFEPRESEPKGTSCWFATVRVEWGDELVAPFLVGWLPVKYRVELEGAFNEIRAASVTRGEWEVEPLRAELERLLRERAPEVTWTVVAEVLP